MRVNGNKRVEARPIPLEGVSAQDIWRVEGSAGRYQIVSYQSSDLRLSVDESGRIVLETSAPTTWTISSNLFPSHDTCETALPVAPGATVLSTAKGASPDNNLFGLGLGFNDGPGVWYKFTGNGGLWHFYVSCENNWDALIKVFTAESCTEFGSVGSEVGGNGYACNAAIEPLQTDSGTEYWVLVSGQTPGESGDFELSVVEDNDAGQHCDSLQVPGSSCSSGCRDFQRACKVPDNDNGFRLTMTVGSYANCRCQAGTLECAASLCASYPM